MPPQAVGRGHALRVEETLPPAELRARRRALGLSQAELAEILGVTSTTVARWERSEQHVGNPERVNAALARLESEVAGSAGERRVPQRPPAEQRRHNLPAQLSSFVGREHDVADVTRLLAGTRLLTVTGTGGIGKTRLALQVAADRLADYGDGVWLIELAPLADPALVARAVAAVMGIREKARRSLAETLAEVLRDRHLLLVLDNCEHLVDACAELAHALLQRCPFLRVLATSREALGLPGEAAWQLPPLGLPSDGKLPTAAEVAQSAAARLFVERVQAVLATFALTDHNAEAIADICHRLEGVPLALELAAARVPVLGLEQIAARLGDRFPVLTGGSRTAPRRHQTLRAAIDWSYDLLSTPERRLFNGLSVFAGGWTLEAAEAVAGEPAGGAPTSVLDLLGQLVAKSLVVAEPWPDGNVRYRQLETLRQYAEARLNESGDAEAVCARQAAYYLVLAEQAEFELRGPFEAVWLDRLEVDHDNLRSALRWYLQQENVEGSQRLGGALWRFWQPRGYLEEGCNWVALIQSLPGADGASPEHAKVLVGAGLLAHYRGDRRISESLCEQALALSRSLGDQAQVAWLLAHLGMLARTNYQYPRARALFEEGLAVARAVGTRIEEAEVLINLGRLEYLEDDLEAAYTALDKALGICSSVSYGGGTVQALRYLGEVAYQRGDYIAARSYIEASLAHARDLRDPWRTAWAACPLGYVLVAQGEFDLARRLWTENLQAWRDLGNMNHFSANLEGLACLAARQGELKRALRLAAAGASIRRAHNALMLPEARMWLDRWLPATQARIGEPKATSAWAEGDAMSVQQAIECAFSAAAPAPQGGLDAGRGPLTQREQEVAALIVRGSTDREIASALVISEQTAHTHVRNILGKLGLQSRVQIAAWAVRAGLPTHRARTATEDT